MLYQCQTCNKQYYEKFNYDRHVPACEFLHRSRRAHNHAIDMEEDILPSQREMYRLMQEMTLEISKLKVEVKKLKQIQTKKIDVLEWLNNQQIQPVITFKEWIIRILYPEIQHVLDTVYQEDLLMGYKRLLRRLITDQTQLPVRAFDNKPNHLYIYEKVPISVNVSETQYHWRKITIEEMDRILTQIDKQFVNNFRTYWYEVHKDKMGQEDYKDMYVNNYAKILGGDRMSDTTRYNHIRQYLYNELKQSVKGYIEI